MNNYKILIIPSTDNERDFEEASNFDEALELAKKQEFTSGTTLFEFETNEEMDAFIQGYESAIGYMGNGAYFRNDI